MQKENSDNDRERAQKLLIRYYDQITPPQYARPRRAAGGMDGKHEEIVTRLAVRFFEGFFNSLGSAMGGLVNRFF
ncbi:hypothetical protein [Dawidia soli]|uniref:Uncharacterized protein n=1 Tax=Dawidia soli TaxID=2782352 RepID=A0AAP2D5I7_9BACT|nr:hypothetical protein [Dawidia soli]MBT1685502.1 hypothetical protein [Dawidia soli]